MPSSFTCILLSDDQSAAHELRQAITADGRLRLVASSEEAEDVYAKIMRLRPAVLFVALDASAEAGLALVERVAAECPLMPIICASRNSSSELILRTVRAGAREFLPLPLDRRECQTAFDRTVQLCAGQADTGKQKGRVVAVFSSKGGCGTSFIAANFAAATGRPTVIVDLNLQAGDLDIYLGVEPKYSITDFIANRERLDDALLASYLVPLSPSLSFLPAPREVATAEDVQPEDIREVIRVLRERFDYVVLDPQHTFDAVTLAALDHADDILLVLTLDIPSIRSTQRALALFDRLGYPRSKVHVVVNRWSKQIDLDLPEVERCLGERVSGFVQSEYRTVVNSINLGHPLVESGPSSIISIQIRGLAATILGAPDKAEMHERKGLFGSIFRRQSAPARLNLTAPSFDGAS